MTERRACVPTPMKPSVSRSFGFVSADQMCDGRMNGAAAAMAELRMKLRRLNRFVFINFFPGCDECDER